MGKIADSRRPWPPPGQTLVFAGPTNQNYLDVILI
jgi:hypothetical protein